jgi:hypothetical protein
VRGKRNLGGSGKLSMDRNISGWVLGNIYMVGVLLNIGSCY